MDYQTGKLLEEIRSMLWNLDSFIKTLPPLADNIKLNMLDDERKKLMLKITEKLK